MRTSPPHVRRGFPRRALAVGLVAALALAGAACTDDGGDDTTPTTTSPSTSDDASTTTEASGSTTTGADGSTTTEGGASTTTAPDASSEPTTEAERGLTDAEAKAQLTRILARYQGELQGAKERNALDEQFQAGLAEVLVPALRDNEVDVLGRIDAPGSLAEVIQPVQIGDVAVVTSGATCVSGRARIDFTPFYGQAAAGPQTYFYKLTIGEGGPDGWRLGALGFTESGDPFPAAQCEEQAG
ncbi:MAG: hypothetical protein ACR2JF_13325 [Iamia sp.]